MGFMGLLEYVCQTSAALRCRVYYIKVMLFATLRGRTNSAIGQRSPQPQLDSGRGQSKKSFCPCLISLHCKMIDCAGSAGLMWNSKPVLLPVPWEGGYPEGLVRVEAPRAARPAKHRRGKQHS